MNGNLVKWSIDDAIKEMFGRLYFTDYTNEQIIATLHEMGYIDLADGYYNWCAEDN